MWIDIDQNMNEDWWLVNLFAGSLSLSLFPRLLILVLMISWKQVKISK